MCLSLSLNLHPVCGELIKEFQCKRELKRSQVTEMPRAVCHGCVAAGLRYLSSIVAVLRRVWPGHSAPVRNRDVLLVRVRVILL